MSKVEKIIEVREAIVVFINAGNHLSNVWQDDDNIAEVLNGTGLYPNVPSFDELMSEFVMWADEAKVGLYELEDAVKKEVIVPYSWIKNTIGWREFAEKTGRNIDAQKEFGFSDKEMFYITKEEAKDIGYL